MIQYQRGQKIELTLQKMVPGGVALGKLPDGRAAFIKGGAPGETAIVTLTRIKKDFAEGELVSVVTPASSRVSSDFPEAALSGANWAYLDYPAQLAAKQEILAELLARLAFIDHPIEPIVPATQQWRYRNKVELTFGTDSTGHVALGFHAPGRFDQIIPTDDIALFPEIGREIIAAVIGWAKVHKLPAYDARRKEGILRNLVIRRAEHTKALLINLVTTPIASLPTAELVAALAPLKASGIIWTENTSVATIVRSDTSHVLAGFDFIDESFLGKGIRYHADSFFQTNTSMAEKMAALVLERLEAAKPEVLIDGYAGVGGFGLFAADRGVKVISIESHPASSADAKANAKRLGVADKMEFINEPMEKYLQNPESRIANRQSHLVVDPPRSGLHPKALAAINQAKVMQLLYVSCNPATLARDLVGLSSGYEVKLIQPFDLFPQTSHMETFVELVAK